MPFDHSDELRYYQFDIFPKNVLNAVFTRHGGISPEPWHSLNLSTSVGDEPDRVAGEKDLSRVGLVDPPDDVHQGALARPVLADQRVHGAGEEGEAHAVQGVGGPEVLADVPDFQNRCCHSPCSRKGRHGRRPCLPGCQFQDAPTRA